MSKPKPTVVEFVEPGVYKKAAKSGRGSKFADDGSDRKEVDTQSFRGIMKTVYELGAERFDARSKKEWEAHKYSKLGAKIVHKVKMPIAMLQGVKKKRKRRAIEAAAEAKESDVVTGKKSKLLQDPSFKNRRDKTKGKFEATRRQAGVNSLDSGRFRDGVLHVKSKGK